MKNFNTVATLVSCLSLATVGYAGQKQTTNNIINGNGNTVTNGQQQRQDIKADVSGPGPKIGGKRRRDLLELFGRAAPAPAPAGGAGGKGGLKPLTADDVISMIKNKQQFPPQLEAAFQGSALSNKFPNRPANLKPPPPELANHPAPLAIEALKAKDIPPAVLAAAQAAWGPAGGSAKGAKASPKFRRDIWDADLELEAREADPEAFFDFDDDSLDLGLVARAALFDDESFFDIEPRHLDVEDLVLYARDALAAADAGFYDDSFELHERAEKWTTENVGQLADLIQTKPKAAKAVVEALNADPKLSQYADELEEIAK